MTVTPIIIATELLSGESFIGFYWSNKSWYAQDNVRWADRMDEINIGIYGVDGGTFGEFSIEWSMLAGKPVAQLQAFDDCWHVLPLVPELITTMAACGSHRGQGEEKDSMTAEALTQYFRSVGFIDLTSTTPTEPERHRRMSAGPIPLSLRVFGDEWTHYATIGEIDDDLIPALKGKHKALEGVMLFTNETDAMYAFLRNA